MPYAHSNHLDRLPGDLELWRYMSFTKFMNLLVTDTLHFHVASGFDDDFEGTVPEAVRDAMEEEYEQATENGLEKHKKLVGVLREITYISCWHNKGYESAAMWSKYGNHDGAIAVETTVENLRNAVAAAEHDIHLAKVEYTVFNEDHRDEEEDDISDIDPEELNRKFLLTHEDSHTIAPFLYKRKSFDYEDEIRAIIQKPSYADSADEEDALPVRIQTEDGWKYIKDDKDSGRNGVEPHVLVNQLVNKIYVSPGSPGWILETVREAVKAKDRLPDTDDEVNSFVVESQLDANPVFSPDSE